MISVGDQVPVITKDDVVWYDKHAGHGIEWDDKFYLVLKAPDIVLIE